MSMPSDSTIKHAGRPLLFETVDELDNGIAQWIVDRRSEGKPLTITSLAVHLNTSRETLMNYVERAEYFDSLKKAKDLCQLDAEDRLYGTTQVAGVIFSLKNNYGWVDKTETDVTSKGESITPQPADPTLMAGFVDYLKGK